MSVFVDVCMCVCVCVCVCVRARERERNGGRDHDIQVVHIPQRYIVCVQGKIPFSPQNRVETFEYPLKDNYVY